MRQRRHRHPNRFLPILLRLEDRTVPSGNVTAVVVGGTLFVTGDGASNKVLIGSVGSHTAGITPLDDTTINGRAGPAMLDGVVNGYVVDMGAGDDVLGISGDANGGNLWINMGDGNDALVLGAANIHGPVAAAMGVGNDALTMLNSSIGSLTGLDGGPGTDRLSVAGTTFGQVPIVLGFEGSGAAPTPVPTPTPTGVRANDDQATVAAGGSVTIDELANDNPGSGAFLLTSVTITRQATAVKASPQGDGTIVYTSTGSTAGTDSFQYTVRNSNGQVSNPATITVTINAATGSSGSVITSPTTTGTSLTPAAAEPPAGEPTQTAAPTPAAAGTTAPPALNPAVVVPPPPAVTAPAHPTPPAVKDITDRDGTATGPLMVDARTFSDADVIGSGPATVIAAGTSVQRSDPATRTEDPAPPVVTLNPFSPGAVTGPPASTPIEAASAASISDGTDFSDVAALTGPAEVLTPATTADDWAL